MIRYHLQFTTGKRVALVARTLFGAMNEAERLTRKANTPGAVHRAEDGLIRGRIERRGTTLARVDYPHPGQPYVSDGTNHGPLGTRWYIRRPNGETRALFKVNESQAVAEAVALGELCTVHRVGDDAVIAVVKHYFDQWFAAAPPDAIHVVEPTKRAPLPGPVTRLTPPTPPPRCHHGLGFNCPTCWPKPPPIRS